MWLEVDFGKAIDTTPEKRKVGFERRRTLTKVFVRIHAKEQRDFLVPLAIVQPTMLDRAEKRANGRTHSKFFGEFALKRRTRRLAQFNVPSRQKSIICTNSPNDKHVALA